ncbi:MAG: hypothetical protein JO117_07170 [Verrucomicrobia bacterium]|nr:hypothetical protein [Verrucomicrobiota bacterium]MBV9658938.1 hypothetical protein [Verrucomicrobiota bacterium]
MQHPPVANLIESLLAPLLAKCGRLPGSALRYSPIGEFHHGPCRYQLPRFVFRGAPGGGDTIRLGLFASIHGDERETALALRDFLLTLADDPAPAQGYELYAYPVCNPSGYEDRTRHSRAGLDLNREFWRGSAQPEVQLLERELGMHGFHGLIALHADDTCDGCYAYVRGATLTEALARPALEAASQFLPLAQGEMIDGFPARDGVITRCPEGVLSNPADPSPSPAPFEIIFETPQKAPAQAQSAAAVAALQSILRGYRPLLAFGENL